MEDSPADAAPILLAMGSQPLTTPLPHNSNLSASAGMTDSELLLHFMPWGALLDRALTPALYALGIAGNALAFRAWHSIHRSRHGLNLSLGLPGVVGGVGLESGWSGPGHASCAPVPAPGLGPGIANGFEGGGGPVEGGAWNDMQMGGPMGAGSPLGAAGRRKRQRVPLPHSARLYLSALALVDGLFLITHVLHELQFAWSVRVLNFPIICDVYFAILSVFASLNPLLVLLVTIDVQLAIRNRLRMRAFCSRRTAQIWVAISAFVSIALAAPKFFLWTFDYRPDQRRCRQRPELENSTAWRIYLTAGEGVLDGAVAILTGLLSVASVINFSKKLKRYSRRQWFMNMCTSFPPYPMQLPPNAAYGHLTQSDNESSVSNELHNQQGFNYVWPQTHSPSRLALYPRSTNNSNNVGGAAGRVSSQEQILRSYRPFVYTLLSLGFLEATCLACDTLAFVVRATVERGDDTLTDEEAHDDQFWQRYFTYTNVRKLLEEVALARHALPALVYIAGLSGFRQYFCSVVTCGCYDGDESDEPMWPFPFQFPMQMPAVGERAPSKLALGPGGAGAVAGGADYSAYPYNVRASPTLNDLRGNGGVAGYSPNVMCSPAAFAAAASIPPPLPPPPPPAAVDESDSESTTEPSPDSSPMAPPATAHRQRAQFLAQPPTLV